MPAIRKLLLTSIGTLGDLYPFIALGLSLKARGFTPVLAVAEDQVAKSQSAGLDAVAILPSFEKIRERMGLSEQEAVRRLMSDQREFLEQILLPSLSTCARLLDDAADGAEAIVSTPFVFAAPIIAEKRRIPLVIAVLQPMAMLSAYDAPATPDFWMARQSPVGVAGAAWNRALYAVMRQVLKRLYSRPLDAVRAQHGLAAQGAANMLEPQRKAPLVLGCYSKLFGPLPADASTRTQIVGFPFFDGHDDKAEVLDPVLADFVRSGPPPIVFTLGTFAVHGGGTFYEEAAATARTLNRRAVLLTDAASGATVEGDVVRCGYVPHSLLFPHAAAIVHHGGIGTTGQALLAGKPQLIVPHMGDQSDHAHRIRRLGIGLSLRASRFNVRRSVPIVRRLLNESSYRHKAQSAREFVLGEHGSEDAATAIANMLSDHATSPRIHSRR